MPQQQEEERFEQLPAANNRQLANCLAQLDGLRCGRRQSISSQAQFHTARTGSAMGVSRNFKRLSARQAATSPSGSRLVGLMIMLIRIPIGMSLPVCGFHICAVQDSHSHCHSRSRSRSRSDSNFKFNFAAA